MFDDDGDLSSEPLAVVQVVRLSNPDTALGLKAAADCRPLPATPAGVVGTDNS